MQPFQVTFRPSRWRLVLHAAAWAWLSVVWLLYFAGWQRWLGGVLTVLLGWHAMSQRPQIERLAVNSSGEAVLFVRPQRIAVAAVLCGGMVLPWLQLLHWQTDTGRRIYQAVWPDSAEAGQLRRLRVWARWGGMRQEHDRQV